MGVRIMKKTQGEMQFHKIRGRLAVDLIDLINILEKAGYHKLANNFRKALEQANDDFGE